MSGGDRLDVLIGLVRNGTPKLGATTRCEPAALP